MYQFLSGMLVVLSLVAALFFFRAWGRSRDRFFLIFALAFALLGCERVILGVLNLPEAPNVAIYIIRLIGFVLIIAGIVEKNWAKS